MARHFVTVKDKNFDDWKAFEVPEPVARYIKQLEAYIRYPELSKLFEAYPELFGNTTYKGLQHKQSEGTDHPTRTGSGKDE